MVILVLFASIVLSAPELLKFLPWRLTNFCMASKGFPTYPAFKWLHTCSILVSISYILSQALLLCPLGTVAVYSDDGKKVRQSVALPSAPQLATYLHSSLGDELSPDMFSTAGIFGIILLGTLGLKLSRMVIKHRQLLTQNRGVCRTCILGALECIQSMRRCGRRARAGEVKPSRYTQEEGLVPVGHIRAIRQYKFTEEDDDDFVDNSIESDEKHYIFNQLRDIKVTLEEEEEEEEEEKEANDYDATREPRIRTCNQREMKSSGTALSSSDLRNIEIEKAARKAKGKLLTVNHAMASGL